ncbi:MAG: hypothetical protein K5678_05610 [Acetatifactor sp.]|nr:hypothetical protein [Acetatifactor sp.]
MKRHSKRIVLYWFLILLLLTGCSFGKKESKEENPVVEGKALGYHREYQELKLPQEVTRGLFVACLTEDAMYYVVPGDSETIYRQGLDGGEKTLVFTNEKEDGDIRGLTVTAEGKFHLLLCSDVGAGRKYFLQSRDGNGKVLSLTDLSNGIQETDLLNGAASLADGRVIIRKSSDGGVSNLIAVSDKGEITEVRADFPRFINEVEGTADGNGILFHNTDGLYEWDGKDACREVLLWGEESLISSNVKFAWKSGQEIRVLTVDVATNKAELVTLREKEEGEETTEQQVLTLAVLYSNNFLERIVSDFNRKHEDCQVQVVKYLSLTSNTTQQDIRDAITRMGLDLLGDQAPDLIDLSFAISYGTGSDVTVEDLLQKGYVLDLTPFAEKSEVVHLADYHEKALEICSDGGKVAAIPYGLRLGTMIADSELADVKAGWTVSDFMTICHQMEDGEFLKGLDRWTVLDLCLAPNVSFFVDEKARQCHFDQKEFREVLQFAAEFPDKKEDFNLYQAKGAIHYTEITQVEEVPRQQFQAFEDHAVYVGFPTFDGKERNTLGISYDVNVLAICGKSKRAEQAWSFIESYLGTKFFDETDMDARMLGTWQYGISANQDMLRTYIDYIKTEGGPFGCTPQEDYLEYMRKNRPHDYIGHPLTDEEESLFYDLLEHAEPETVLDKICMSIITEEAGAYFSEQKDLDEVVGIIQERIQLFLTENQ